MRVPRDSPGQWTCDYCGINRCWATRSTCYRCGEARGHTEEMQRHYRNLAREAREKGLSGASAAAGSSCMSPPWAAKAPPPRSVPPRTPRASSPAPWAAPKSLSLKWTRSTTMVKQLFFDRLWSCLRTAAFHRVFSMKFGKLFLRIVLRRGKRRKFLENKLCWT